MKYYRTIITIANTGELIYGKFHPMSQDELLTAKDMFEQINKISYLMVESETGDFTYVKGDAIAHVKLEMSQR